MLKVEYAYAGNWVKVVLMELLFCLSNNLFRKLFTMIAGLLSHFLRVFPRGYTIKQIFAQEIGIVAL